MIKIPSGKYFISHSYKDADVRSEMIRKLPNDVKPFIFPPINVSPQKFVSNSLIDAILDCDGLIYLQGGYSAKSFWVAFERDYALRAKKPIYFYEPETDEFVQHVAPPVSLQIYNSYSRHNIDLVTEILNHMETQRYFQTASFYRFPPTRELRDRKIRSNIVEKLNRGGYLIVFWSENASQSPRMGFEIQFGYEYGQAITNPANPNNDRILLALLDETPLPSWLQTRLSQNANMIQPIQLYGDKKFSMINRIDDLVVRLYWLIFRNQFPELSYE